MTTEKTGRGFASMDKERLRALSSAAGKASHAMGVGHELTSEKARAIGRLGGLVSGVTKRARKSGVGYP